MIGLDSNKTSDDASGRMTRPNSDSWTGGASADIDFAAVEVAASALSVSVGQRILGRLAGDHRGIGAGQGMDPRDLREYAIGDDVRHIDWNATARTGDAQIRTFEAERELEITFVVDLSGSTHLGSGRSDKRSVVIGSAATVGLSIANGMNRMGLVAFDGAHAHQLPSRAGKVFVRSAMAFADGLVPAEDPARRKGFESALDLVATSTSRTRRIVVVVSDFLDLDLAASLERVALDNHLFAVHVVDHLDTELPDVGRISFVDPETGHAHRTNTGSRAVRSAYKEAALAHRNDIARTLRGLGAGRLELHTHEDWLKTLVNYFADGTIGSEVAR